MDMWTDPNLTPYMAITGHWIQHKKMSTPSGDQQLLELRADLVGFLRVPGHHTGQHLAHTFTHITDRLKITNLV